MKPARFNCLTPEMLEELSSFFKMLGEPVRLRLLSSLCIQGEATVGELVERLNIGQSVVSKHMKLLHESGHVEKRSRRVGSYTTWPTIPCAVFVKWRSPKFPSAPIVTAS